MGSAAAIGAVAAVATAGVGIAGAAGAFAPGTPGAPNIGAMTSEQIVAAAQATPINYAYQALYNPKFAALDNQIAYNNLFGTPAGPQQSLVTANNSGWYDANGKFLAPDKNPDGQPVAAPRPRAHRRKAGDQFAITQQVAATPGQLDLVTKAQPALNAIGTSQRAATISDVATLGPAAYQAIRGYNPAATNLLDTATQQTQDLVNTNGALDPFLQRALQQNYRGGEAARGTAGGTSDAAMESYYEAATQEQRRLQNLNLAQTVTATNQAYDGDPFMQVAGRSSGQTPNITTTANQPSATAGTAALINPGLTSLQSQGYQAQQTAAQAAYSSQQAYMGGIGKSITGLGQGVSALMNYF